MHICFECVDEAFLRDKMRKEGTNAECGYCGESRRGFSIASLAALVKAAFAAHYTRTADEPDAFEQMAQSDRENDYYWTRSGERTIEAIASAAGIPENAAADVQQILDDELSEHDPDNLGYETEFSLDAHYTLVGADTRKWQVEWSNFERSLKTETRHFNSIAAAHLARIFSGLDSLRTENGRSPIVQAGPETELSFAYRARVFQDDASLRKAMCRPDVNLGPPPSAFATSGRMNARGVSVFYGALDPETALAEVRPPVGSSVAVVRFNIIRSLRLLDVGAMKTVRERGSVFDPTLRERQERVAFLRSLCDKLARAVMPDDEAMDYIPTQAVADFLSTDERQAIDGVMFPSVQSGGGGTNVILFHKASRVTLLDIPPGTKIDAHTYMMSSDGPEPDYSVLEQTPPIAEDVGRTSGEQGITIVVPEDHLAREPIRVPTLTVDTESMHVHLVQRVAVRTHSEPVRRTRSTRMPPQF